jgi:hypothetical protein
LAAIADFIGDCRVILLLTRRFSLGSTKQMAFAAIFRSNYEKRLSSPKRTGKQRVLPENKNQLA